MTQKELGEALGVHWNSVARMERNEFPIIRTTELAVKYPHHEIQKGRKEKRKVLEKYFNSTGLRLVDRLYHRGREIRQSSESESEAQARKILKKRVGELTDRRFIADEEKLTFEQLVVDMKNDYQVNGKRSMGISQLLPTASPQFFGLDRAIDIMPDRVRAYQNHRLSEERRTRP